MAGKGKKLLTKKPSSSKSTKSASPDRPKITREEVTAKRQLKKNQALEDLHKAEDLVLELLTICSDTTRRFSLLSTGDDKDEDRGTSAKVLTKQESSMTSASGTSTTDSASECGHWDMIARNGTQFQDSIKKIHALLVPHAGLVVNYDYGDGNATTQNNGGSKTLTHSSDAAESDSKKEGSKNMYESRMEMKLAIERRNLVQDLLRLEQQQRDTNKKELETESSLNDESSLKRKREE